MSDELILSVVVLTYNQEKYIRKCLDGILMQKVNFKYEILINDDCSTDGTAEIINEYQEKYPDIIKPIFQKENQFSKGKTIFLNYLVPRIKTKYCATCEGDDYWTDPNKLQKQVDFLETHPEYTMCCHRVKVTAEDSNKSFILPKNKDIKKSIIGYEGLLKRNPIQTCSVMYRWGIKVDEIKEAAERNIIPCDIYLHLLHAKHGKVKCLKDIMSVYRQNSGGVWWDSTRDRDNWQVRFAIRKFAYFYCVYKYITNSSDEYLKIKAKVMNDCIKALLRCKKFDLLKKIEEEYPKLYDYAVNYDKYKDKYEKYKKLFRVFLVIGILLFLLNIGQLFRILNLLK